MFWLVVVTSAHGPELEVIHFIVGVTIVTSAWLCLLGIMDIDVLAGDCVFQYHDGPKFEVLSHSWDCDSVATTA